MVKENLEPSKRGACEGVMEDDDGQVGGAPEVLVSSASQLRRKAEKLPKLKLLPHLSTTQAAKRI